jgi:N6-L-threonylcarbamoyladenine synthase
MARAFEDAAVEVLVEKTRKAIVQLEDQIHTLIVAGGVSANNHLALEIKKLVDNFSHITLRMPEKTLSTDNALMIGVAAFVTIHTRPETINQTPISASGRLSLNS